MEGKWLRGILREVCVEQKLNEGDTERVLRQFGLVERMFDGLGFCLSENGDILSQWRGYAADGMGFSIGFSAEYLNRLSEDSRQDDGWGFSLQRVEYDIKKQKQLVRPTYDAIREQIEKGAFRFGRATLLDTRSEDEIAEDERQRKKAYHNLGFRLLSLFPELYRTKNPAFREEREWRLISYFVQNQADSCEF